MATVGTVISRVRNQVKGVRQDAFLTDRYLYSVITKYSQLLMRRQDSANKLMKFNAIWQALPCVELIEVDKVEACCAGIKSGCTIKRTKEKLPLFLEGYWGPLIRTVSSIDGTFEAYPTTPGVYTSMTKTTGFKYNKQKYFWYLDGYMYFPNLDWDAVKIEGVFDEDISTIGENGVNCTKRQKQLANVPDFLFAEIEKMAMQDLAQRLSIPTDKSDDNINLNR